MTRKIDSVTTWGNWAPQARTETMTATATTPAHRDPELLGQTVVVIGGSSGIGLATAKRARTEGADVIITGFHTDSTQRAATEVGALSFAAFDANDPAELARFFAGLSNKINHVMVTAGAPEYGRLLDTTHDELRHALSDRLLLALETARNAVDRIRPEGRSCSSAPKPARRASAPGAWRRWRLRCPC